MGDLNGMSGIPWQQVQASRHRLGVPDDWEVSLCAAQCGDIVFYPPGSREQAEAQGTPFLITCSTECVQTLLDRSSA